MRARASFLGPAQGGIPGAPGPAGADGAQGPAGPDGGGSVEVVYSNVAQTAYGTSGILYVPLAKNATEQYVEFQLTAWQTGNLNITLKYAMSSSHAGAVALSVASLAVGDGEDPNGALSEAASFTVTPGSDQNQHTVDPDDSATMAVAVTAGDIVRVRIRRKNVGGDTHTGSMNVTDIRLEIA